MQSNWFSVRERPIMKLLDTSSICFANKIPFYSVIFTHLYFSFIIICCCVLFLLCRVIHLFYIVVRSTTDKDCCRCHQFNYVQKQNQNIYDMSINATDNVFVCLLAELRLGIIIIFSSSMDGGSVHNRFTCELNGYKLFNIDATKYKWNRYLITKNENNNVNNSSPVKDSKSV